MEINWEAIRITLAAIPCAYPDLAAEPSSRFMPIAAVAFPPGRAAVQVRTLAPANVYSGNAGVLINPERRFSRSRPRIVMTWLWCGSRSRIAVATTGSPNTRPHSPANSRICRGSSEGWAAHGSARRAARGQAPSKPSRSRIVGKWAILLANSMRRSVLRAISRSTRKAAFRRLSPDLGRRLADRCRPELDSARVLSSSWFTLRESVARTYPGAPRNGMRDYRRASHDGSSGRIGAVPTRLSGLFGISIPSDAPQLENVGSLRSWIRW